MVATDNKIREAKEHIIFLIEQRTHYSVLVRVIHRSRGKLACIVAGRVADTKTVEHLQNKQSIDQGKNRNLICRNS
jgi:hypothetical protein